MEYLITVGILGLGYVYSNNGKKKLLNNQKKVIYLYLKNLLHIIFIIVMLHSILDKMSKNMLINYLINQNIHKILI